MQIGFAFRSESFFSMLSFSSRSVLSTSLHGKQPRPLASSLTAASFWGCPNIPLGNTVKKKSLLYYFDHRRFNTSTGKRLSYSTLSELNNFFALSFPTYHDILQYN